MIKRAIISLVFSVLTFGWVQAQTIADSISLPCVCTHYNWEDDKGWTKLITDSILYNEHGDKVIQISYAPTGYKEINIYPKGPNVDTLKQYTYQIAPSGDTISMYLDKSVFNECSNVVYHELDKWSFGRWTIDNDYHVERKRQLVFEADSLYYAPPDTTTQFTNTITTFGYDELGRLKYKLVEDHWMLDEFDSTYYDISKLDSEGILTEYVYEGYDSGQYFLHYKVIRGFESFNFPKNYITGQEYFDKANHPTSKRVYIWVDNDPCIEEMGHIPLYPTDCNTCIWLESIFNEQTTYLPNGNEIKRGYAKGQILNDSTFIEKDDRGKIIREYRYGAGVRRVSESNDCKFKYVVDEGSSSVTKYMRKYDKNGNEVDLIIKKSTDGLMDKLKNSKRTTCGQYKSFKKK